MQHAMFWLSDSSVSSAWEQLWLSVWMWPGAEGKAVLFLQSCGIALGASWVGWIPAGEGGKGEEHQMNKGPQFCWPWSSVF